MGVLESVLAYKAKKDADAAADLQAIPQGIAAFTQARQVAQKSMLDKLTLDVTAGAHGLRIDPRTGTISRDPSLIDPSKNISALNDMLGLRQKAAEQGVDLSSLGIGGTNQNSKSQASSQVGEDDSIVLERNAFGVPSKTISRSGLKEQKKAEQIATANVKREDLRKDLEGILALESTIPRSQEGGLDRFLKGAKNKISGLSQSSAIGENIATYKKAIDSITPKVARATGDVANIAVAERKFSKNIFPQDSDTEGTSKKKRAVLIQLSEAIDANNPNAITQVLDEQGVPYYNFTDKKWHNLGEGEVPPEEVDISKGKSSSNLPKPTASEIAQARSKGFTKWSPTKGFTK